MIALREDLRLFPAASNKDGSPSWMVQDPVTNRFFQIGWLEFEVLSRWPMQDPERIAQAIESETPLAAEADDVIKVIGFFQQHQLMRASDPQGVAALSRIADSHQLSKWKWLLHNYLFFRVPLVHPQKLLNVLTPLIGFIYRRWFVMLSVLATLLGLTLVARQWDVFLHTFEDFMSPAGLAGYLAALIFAKTLHEMGHAVTATRYGVRVAHMGVAFLVMWPMLYTDTGESWKLSDRRARFHIAAAGVLSEFMLAGYATLAWSLTEDGSLRSALFFLATTSWIITIGINASPFMRFDGYFLASDALDIPNLHARSFAMARAWMRRLLLGWNEPDPELFEPRMRRLLIGFALVTWIYRLVVFVGIAVAVYVFFFKALGIFLFVVEVLWFIARPVWSELKIWIQRRQETSMIRKLVMLSAMALALVMLALPWRLKVHGEAWLHAENQQVIYSPFPARVLEVHAGGLVKKGDTLVVLDSPDTRSKANLSRLAADSLALQMDQSVGRVDGAEKRNVFAEQMAEQLAELEAQKDELKRLKLVASFDGKVVDRDRQIQSETWVTANQPIAILIDPKQWIIDALVEQRDLENIKVGAKARFFWRNTLDEPLSAVVVAMDTTRAQALPDPMLATDRGGRVPVLKAAANGAMVPRDALYRVRLNLDQPINRASTAMGSVAIEGAERSLLMQWGTALAAVFVRESGF
jgi:putative peptide zinc metalloprotease protein